MEKKKITTKHIIASKKSYIKTHGDVSAVQCIFEVKQFISTKQDRRQHIKSKIYKGKKSEELSLSLRKWETINFIWRIDKYRNWEVINHEKDSKPLIPIEKEEEYCG